MSTVDTPVKLPRPRLSNERSLESTLHNRRSVREYSRKALTRGELAQLLWAAQGITDPEGLRTTPSAGALYPLEVEVVSGNVDDLPSAIYRYKPDRHALVLVKEGDWRRELAAAALGLEYVGTGAAVIALAARTGPDIVAKSRCVRSRTRAPWRQIPLRAGRQPGRDLRPEATRRLRTDDE